MSKRVLVAVDLQNDFITGKPGDERGPGHGGPGGGEDPAF